MSRRGGRSRRLANLATARDVGRRAAAAETPLLDAKLTKKAKARVDRVAAQMILQSFIDAGSPAGGTDTIFTKPSPDGPSEPTSN